MDGAAAPDQKPWPWARTSSRRTSRSRPIRTPSRWPRKWALTEADVAKLGFDQSQGGFQGMTLVGPSDGMGYLVSLRPLLPDEPDTRCRAPGPAISCGPSRS